MANILKQADAKGESYASGKLDELREPAEKALRDAIRITKQKADDHIRQGEYTEYLRTFSVLKAPVDTFFDQVMVMVDDVNLRRARLALLYDLRESMNHIADISKLAQ